MEKIFSKNRVYSEMEIIDIASANGMITVDCLKDDNLISIEFEGADSLFELTRKRDDEFILTWSHLDC